MRRTNVLWLLAASLWRYAHGHRGWVILYVSMATVASATGLAGPLIMAELMNAVQRLSGSDLESRALWLMLLYLLVGFAFWFIHGPSRIIENTIAFHVKRAFQVLMLEKVTALPTRWHRDNHSGKTIDQVSRAGQALGEFAESGFEVLHLLSRFGGSVILLTWFMPVAGAAIGAVTAVVIVTIVAFDRTLVRQYEELNLGNNRVASAVQDYLTNIGTVLSLRLEGRVVREVRDRISAMFPLYRRNIVINELKWFTSTRLVDGSQSVLVLVLVLSLARGKGGIAVGTVYAVSEYLRSIGDSFLQFTWKYGTLVMQGTKLAAVGHIEEAFDAEVRASAEAGLPSNWRTLEVRKLEFRHADSIHPALVVPELVLERGKSYACVGESGSGKSTLLGVLRGLHATYGAEVLCDGVPLPHGIVHINHQTTLIPQDPEIFSDSIRFNVTMGVEATEERVLRAVTMARFDRVLQRLPRGLDTSIAEKGVTLSGGERQRLALARGLFFEEEIASGLVLLDEPTSSVDALNEREIYQTLLEQYRDRCVISAVHKYHLLDLFDTVLVFCDGRIVQVGPARELCKTEGELSRIWSAAR